MLLLKESLIYVRFIRTWGADVQEVLKHQVDKNKKHYSHFSADTKDIMVESETRIKDPLKLHDFDTADLFLSVLGDVFKSNVIVFESDGAKCRVDDLSNQRRLKMRG